MSRIIQAGFGTSVMLPFYVVCWAGTETTIALSSRLMLSFGFVVFSIGLAVAAIDRGRVRKLVRAKLHIAVSFRV